MARANGEWVPLESSNLQQAKYDSRLKMLTIQFHGRADDGTGEYIFLGVSQGLFDELCEAVSPGKFYHQRIKGKFQIYKGMQP